MAHYVTLRQFVNIEAFFIFSEKNKLKGFFLCRMIYMRSSIHFEMIFLEEYFQVNILNAPLHDFGGLLLYLRLSDKIF